jgi:hypothetical protein
MSDPFTIDRTDLAKPLTFRIYYEAITGSSNANWSGIVGSQSFAVYLYDVTNSAWVQPAGAFGMNQSVGPAYVTGTFQTSSTSGQQYRLILMCLQATTGAISLEIDEVSVTPQTAPLGAVDTDWQPYTLQIISASGPASNPSKATSPSVDQAYWRRVGDSIHIRYNYRQSSAVGAVAGSGDYIFKFPNNLVADASKIGTPAGVSNPYTVGTGRSQANNPCTVNLRGNTGLDLQGVILVDTVAGGSTIGGASANNLANANASYGIDAVVPIAGWGSNVQLSNDTDTRVVVMGAYGSTTSVNNSGVNVIYPTVRMDSHGGYNPSTGVYTVPVSGYYRVSGGFTTLPAAWVNNNAIQMSASITGTGAPGGTFAFTRIISAGTTEQGMSGSATYYCAAGDTIVLRVLSGQTVALNGGTNNFVSIERLSGPSVIAATETVAASYWASTSASSSTTTAINFDTREYDTHNAVTPGVNWRYTAPVSGTYLVAIYVNASTGTPSYFNIYKNSTSTIYKSIGYATTTTVGNGTTSLKLNAGDYIGIYTSASYPYFGNASLNTQNTSHITIIRTGN